LQHAYLAVDMFFMLSGLVLALNYASTVTLGAGSKPYLSFIQKRIARVFPLYLFVTVVKTAYDLSKHIGLGLAMPDTWELKTMIANLFLVQAWGISESAVGPAWSLSTEFGAYILFPILVALTIHSRTAVAWIMTILSGALLVAAAIGNSGCTTCTGYLDIFRGDTLYPLMRCVAGFTFGLIGYRLWSVPSIRAIASANLFALLSAFGMLGAYFAGLPDLAIYALLFATVMACLGNSKAANAMFGNRVVFFFGKISFSIYLVHILLAPAVKRVVASFRCASGPLLCRRVGIVRVRHGDCVLRGFLSHGRNAGPAACTQVDVAQKQERRRARRDRHRRRRFSAMTDVVAAHAVVRDGRWQSVRGRVKRR
jgi:peptidoglycan/LPS O-acetylase OafA/YrhL